MKKFTLLKTYFILNMWIVGALLMVYGLEQDKPSFVWLSIVYIVIHIAVALLHDYVCKED